MRTRLPPLRELASTVRPWPRCRGGVEIVATVATLPLPLLPSASERRRVAARWLSSRDREQRRRTAHAQRVSLALFLGKAEFFVQGDAAQLERRVT